VIASVSEWMERRSRAVSIAVFGLAVALRVAVAVAQRDHFFEDRDAYLAIARNLAAGHGYVSVVGGSPTAYRPPLYPILLALLFRLGCSTVGIAALHTAAGVGTVWLTLRLGRRLGLGAGRFLAAILVAVDPLLVQYTTFPMTETVFTFLVMLLLTAGYGSSGTSAKVEGWTWRQVSVGVLFGLCALCRPTIWAFGGLAAFWWCLQRLTRRPDRGWSLLRQLQRSPFVLVLAAGLTVAPWVVRNWRVFGVPIVTTTHGGYTLLLGNNPVFYREVVAQPWGAVWSGESLRRWQETLRHEMETAQPPVRSEPARDRWMYRRAWRNIARQPALFLRSCWLRFRRLWSPVPLGPARAALPSPLVWAIGWYYLVVTAGMVLGLLRLPRTDWRRWMPLLLLLVAFTVVHLLYWSNMRMRAPLVPAIALFCALGFFGLSNPEQADGQSE